MAPQNRGGASCHGPANLGLGSGCVHLWRRRGAGVRAETHGRIAGRSCRARALVQPLRSSTRLAGDDTTPRSGGVVVLPPFLYGPAARRWVAETGAEAFLETDAGARDLPVVPFRRSSPGRCGEVDEGPGCTTPSNRPELGRQPPSERTAMVRP